MGDEKGVVGNVNQYRIKTDEREHAKQIRSQVLMHYLTLNGGLEFAALALRVRVRMRVRVQLVKEQQQLLALLDKHGLNLSVGEV